MCRYRFILDITYVRHKCHSSFLPKTRTINWNSHAAPVSHVAVLPSVANPECLSGIRIFSHPRFLRIPDFVSRFNKTYLKLYIKSRHSISGEGGREPVGRGGEQRHRYWRFRGVWGHPRLLHLPPYIHARGTVSVLIPTLQRYRYSYRLFKVTSTHTGPPAVPVLIPTLQRYWYSYRPSTGTGGTRYSYRPSSGNRTVYRTRSSAVLHI